jgi:hypothetical protein
MQFPSLADLTRAISSNQDFIRQTIFAIAMLLGLILFVRALIDFYDAASNPSQQTGVRDGITKLLAAGLLTSVTYSFTAVAQTVFNQASITAYAAPGPSNASTAIVASVVSLSIIINLFGFGWFVQACYRYSALGQQRSQMSGGGVTIQLIFAAACINIIDFVALVQSLFGFQTTVVDWLQQYGVR